MKANEASERIYCESDGLGNIVKVHNIKWPDDEAENIEYTRTDAFIEKACEWLAKNADKYIWYSDYAEYPVDETCGMNDDFIEDFQKYMKGE